MLKISKKTNIDIFKSDENSDELLEFLKINNNLEDVFLKFGNLLYEYELMGRVKIDGVKVSAI